MPRAVPFSVTAEPLDPRAGSDDVQALLRYWDEKRASRRFPARRDIDPLELRGYLGDVSLLDVRREPLDFVYRLAGSKLARDTGYDLTGRSVREIRPAAYAEKVFAQLAEAAATGMPRLHRVSLEVEEQVVEYLRLALPLGTPPEVSMLLTYSQRPPDAREVFEALVRG
jgi:hypothetical protein